MEVYTWQCLPFPAAKISFCSNHWIWISASCPCNFHLPPCDCWGLLSIQQGSPFHCPCSHLCSYVWYCWLHSHFLLSSAGGNKLGEKSDIDWLLVLWASFLDILLLKHCCDSIQCYSSFAFWYYHCHYSHLGTCNLSSPSAGCYSWEK